MKLSLPAVLILIVVSASAQTLRNPWFYQPLGRVQQFLQLTDSQLQAILTNNGEYNQFATTKQTRISQLRSEIATETAKDSLDPLALGTRYAEIESLCRELRDEATTYQQRNTTILTDPQKAKLQVLQDAMKLAPVISDAQAGNLIASSAYAPLFYTSTSTGTASGSAIGGVIGPVSGCYSPFPTAAVRTGDFSAAPTAAGAVQAERTSGSVPPQQMRRTVSRWFDTTKFVEPPRQGNQE
jgi:hypothetical protein